MTNPIDRLIRGSVKCVICGAAYGACDCWTKCACGMLVEKGTKCRNPVHKPGKKRGKPGDKDNPLRVVAIGKFPEELP